MPQKYKNHFWIGHETIQSRSDMPIVTVFILCLHILHSFFKMFASNYAKTSWHLLAKTQTQKKTELLKMQKEFKMKFE